MMSREANNLDSVWSSMNTGCLGIVINLLACCNLEQIFFSFFIMKLNNLKFKKQCFRLV